MDGLLNLIRREVARCMARYAHPVAGIITSYDPVTHAVKVQYQPEGTLSGWIPLNAAGVGAGFGVFVGPHVGHSVSIGFQEGDREAPFVIGRLPTDIETPVSVAEGEIVAKHESGSSFSLLKDGSVALASGQGSSFAVNAAGSIRLTDKLGGVLFMGAGGNWTLTPSAGVNFTITANGSSIGIDSTGNLSLTLATGKAMQVSGAGGAGVSIDGSGNCLVNGTSVLLGGALATKKVALDGDPVVGGVIVASSTLVRAK